MGKAKITATAFVGGGLLVAGLLLAGCAPSSSPETTRGPDTTSVAPETSTTEATITSDTEDLSGGPGHWNERGATVTLNQSDYGRGIVLQTEVGDFYVEKVHSDADTGDRKFRVYSSSIDPGVLFDSATEAINTLETSLGEPTIHGY